jgi:hypothetical protein
MEWVEADECGDKWPEFLRKMQETLASAGEIDGATKTTDTKFCSTIHITYMID